MKLNAKELREVEEKDIEVSLKALKRHPIYFILENIYDTYNVGGIFRLADAIGVSKMYLCGQMEIPPNSKIKKASIGTYKIVPWEYRNSAAEAIEEVRSIVLLFNGSIAENQKNNNETMEQSNNHKIQVIAVEQSSSSVPYIELDYQLPLALVFGNETFGVLPETLKLVDHVAEIPMWGINKSLNVIVSAAIVSYWAMSKMEKVL
ncbi:MAG: TrmH family RNA methyltransferase [bacterium]|nr:TrmH family RNA methyltransferase [bacterium]